MIVALLRSGHSRVLEYGYARFKTAIEELHQHQQDQIVDMAYAHRVAQSDNDHWKKFIEDHEKAKPIKKPKPKKKKMTADDHRRVIARLRGI